MPLETAQPTAGSSGNGQFLQEAPEEVPTGEGLPVEGAGEAAGDAMVEGATTVAISDTGFEPADVTVSAGDTVTFVNNGQAPHWPASDVHPTHTSYPGSDIQKCGTAEAAGIFDACKGLQTGEEYSFTFTEPGSWEYHDHLNARQGGTITVE